MINKHMNHFKTNYLLETIEVKKKRIMIIMRGYPGSGKSYAAKELAKKFNAVICSADDFFMKAGKYVFDASKLGLAHKSCQEKAYNAMVDGKNLIIDNTNLKSKDCEFYVDMVSESNEFTNNEYAVSVITPSYTDIETAIKHRKNQDDGKNIPEDKMRLMDKTMKENDVESELKNKFKDVKFIKESDIDNWLHK